jgi:alpha-glucosidase
LSAAAVTVLMAALVFTSCGEYHDTGEVRLTSPDGKIEMVFALKAMELPYPEGNNMYYTVSYQGKQLLVESPLGLQVGDAGNITGDLIILGSIETAGVDQYDTPFGKQSSVKDDYKEVVVTLRQKQIPAITFDFIMRAYNDGVAFRYHLPQQEPEIKFPSAEHEGFLEKFVLTNEMTGYYFPSDVETFGMYQIMIPPHNYEANYRQGRISDVTRDSTVALPLLVQYDDGTAVCLAEANLADYPASYVSGSRNIDFALSNVLVPLPGEKQVKGLCEIPFTSPWRVLMIASKAGKLIESNLITSLSEPSKISDVSWIKPGKASWDWWSGKVVSIRRGQATEGGFETETYKHYIDFAAANKLEYALIDDGWYGDGRNPEEDATTAVESVDMPYLIHYADSLGVKLMLWINWENLMDGSADSTFDKMDKAFATYQQWGIAGVKIDFMDRDDQIMVNWYRKTLELAASHKLMVDFHGAIRPDGLRRTWPNLITREGVLGLEYVKWSELCNPVHDVTIPYTRMLVGPMDYTPGGFNNSVQGKFTTRMINPMTMGTRAHQLAMFIVYESPLTVLADSPSSYEGEKGLDLISMVPTVWDETRFVDGTPGEYVVLARRKGNTWYLGAMTNWDGREIEVPLDFLGGGSWNAKIWADGGKADQDAESIDVLDITVDASAPLALKLASGGGCAVVLSK